VTDWEALLLAVRSSRVKRARLHTAVLLVACDERARMREVVVEAEAPAQSAPAATTALPVPRDPAAAQKALARGRAFAAQAEWLNAEAQFASGHGSSVDKRIIAARKRSDNDARRRPWVAASNASERSS